MSSESDSWRPANFDGPDNTQQRTSGWETPGPSIEDIQMRGFMSGFEQGRNEGLMRARQEMESERKRLGLLFVALEQMYEQTEDDTLEELAYLSAVVAEQVVRSELTLQPERLRDLVSELMSQLPPGYKQVSLSMHGDVLLVLQEAIESTNTADDTSHWRLVVDDELPPGDFTIRTDDSVVSFQIREMVESMITAALKELFDDPEGT